MNFKKVVVLLIVLTLVAGLNLFSAAKKPVVKKGASLVTMKGNTRHWKDVEKISLDRMPKARRLRPILNFDRDRPLINKETQNDPVAQTSHVLKKHGIKAMVNTIDFAGMNLTDNGAGWPPDTTGDVGLDYYVQAVNTSIGIYSKATGALVSATTFDAFFGGTGITGTPCDENNNGDPIILFDQYNQRWFILDFAWDASQTDGSYYSIAVSQTSDPTGAWYQYAFRADDTLMNDYPKCGVWQDGIYITANMFSFSGGYQHVKVWALQTPALYNGTLNAQSLTDNSYEAFSLLPANAKGSIAPTAGTPNYMYAMDADEYGAPSTDALYVWEYSVDWDTPANTTWTGPTTHSVSAFGLTGSGIPQQGTSTTLDSIYGRLMFPASYRKFAGYEATYLCHVCEYNGARVTRWYELRIDGSGNHTIHQEGTYAPDTNHRWMASIAADKDGNIALGYSISSDSMYPSIRYSGRLATDPLGELSLGEASIQEGTGYQSGFSRWGDYSTMSIDPSDDETFWYTQEYYAANGSDWQTRVGAFKLTGTDIEAPVISDVAYESLGMDHVTITWSTNEAADSEVQYGLTTAYGSSETVSGYVMGHSIDLTSLAPDTTYHYKVISSDSSGNTSESADATFHTYLIEPLNYCDSWGSSQADEWIAEIAVGSLNNVSGDSPYTDFTSITGNFIAGETLDVTLTPEHPGYAYTEYWTIWIDFNVDGDFEDAGEEVFSGSGTAPVTGTFTLPNVECETRMRISMKWGSYSTPCENFSYGEVEDYSVVIEPGVILEGCSVIGSNSVYFKTRAAVNSGDVAVLDATPGPWLQDREAVLDYNVSFDDSVTLYADDVKLKSGASINDVYCNTLTNQGGTVRGAQDILALPMEITLPVFPTPAPGTVDYVLKVHLLKVQRNS
ncbi:MAG: hypothetical protein GY757_48645 [bacterium]|nr:hypothetical protein [bacterium]